MMMHFDPMNTTENTEETVPAPQPLPVAAPLPLESLAPLPSPPDSGREWEKGQYWNQLLTGDPATVPDALRRKAGVDDAAAPAEERDYRLVSTINRSWVVDHKGLSREQVRSEWPTLRRAVARELDVPDDENEVFAALSVQQAEAPRRESAQRVFRQHYEAALRGEAEPAEPPDELAAGARELGQQERERYLPLAESLAEGWSALRSLENDVFTLPAVVQGAPGLWQAVDALAELAPAERARVYAVARSLEPVKALESRPAGVLPSMLRSARRGSADISHAVVQGGGHILAALTRAAGETLDSESLRGVSRAVDKRLQTLDELRRVAQDEVFPIELEEGSGLAAQLAVDAAGAAPGAALAFAGGVGFGVLALAGAGAAVAEARRRAPQGRQELQTAAGILGGALQACIYLGMSRIGARMLDRSINSFVRAQGGGARAYSLAALQTLGSLTAENAKLLLAGKAAQGVELGLQELAAQVDGVASHIDWEQFGHDFMDIEVNMREAARNLPFVLIAAGRAALHHFRSPDSVLGDTQRLAEWGVDAAAHARLLELPDIHTRSAQLQQLLSSSRRWSAPGSLPDWVRALSLLNPANQRVFHNPARVAEFLNLPASTAGEKPAAPRPLSPEQPERMLDVYERMTGRRAVPPNAAAGLPFVRLWEDWFQRSHGELRLTPAENERRNRFYRELAKNPELAVPPELRRGDYYQPYREEAARLLLADRFAELTALSYRVLTNLETLDSLRGSYKSAEHAARAGEELRRRVLSQLLMAFRRSVSDETTPEAAFDHFCEQFGELYRNRRTSAQHAPLWLRQTGAEQFRHMQERAVKKSLRKRNEHPRLTECYDILLGMRRCAGALMGLLPHTDAFQAQLANGRSPEMAAAAVLQREFREQLDDQVWEMVPDSAPAADDGTAEPHAEVLRAYSAVSGHAPESSPDGKGGRLWRIMRPDGRYTFWYADPAQAVNELVGNVRLMFLPMGRVDLSDQIQQMYKGRSSYLRDRLLPRPGEYLTGFEQLGLAATRELCGIWLGRATYCCPGLEFAPDFGQWLQLRGPVVGQRLKSVDAAAQQYATRQSHMLTPLHLAQQRFLVHWNRLLNSGWVPVEEAAELLVQQKMLTRREAEKILQAGAQKPLSLRSKTGPERRRLAKKYPEGVLEGDSVSVCHRLARHLADLNLAFMLTELPDAGLPRPVHQWFSMAPVCYADPPADRPMPLRMNPDTAAAMKRLVPLVNELRRQQAGGVELPLAALMREAYRPSAATRTEQGWCYAIGGEAAFRGAAQQYWNLLREPARAYRLLDPAERELVDGALRDHCGGREPAAALQELQEVLQQYPELRSYGRIDRHAGSWTRLVPAAAGAAAAPEYIAVPSTHLVRPRQVTEDFSLEPVESLPAEWLADSRVVPALQLLGELRTLAADAPYADAQGIRWRNEYYGGLRGRRPGRFGNHWQPELGLVSLLDFFGRVAGAAGLKGTDGALEVCGVKLGGIHPDELRPGALRHITIYHNTVLPDQLVRLMPGNPAAANPRERVPYVVHTSDGVPLFRTSMARRAELLPQVLFPMNQYVWGQPRAFDFERTALVRESHMDILLADLLERRAASPAAWKAGNHGGTGNLELIMQIFQDGRLPYFLPGRDPAKLTRGEALAAELARLCLLAECGTTPAPHIGRLVDFAAKLRGRPEDMKQLRLALRRVVSPFPNEYAPEELNPTPAR